MSRDKRRYRDYDADEEDSKEKKRRVSAPINVEDRLESLITRVGEKSTSSLENNLEGLAGVLETDIPNYRERILHILCTCVTNLPEKTTVYSTLVGLLNVKNHEFGKEFLDMMITDLKDVITGGQFDRARLMIRFLADLVNCNFIEPTSLLAVFQTFLDVAKEDGIPQVRSDWHIYCVMSSLAWCGKELSSKKLKELEQMLRSIESYLGSRNKLHTASLRVWSVDDPHPQEEYLDCLWSQIKKMKADSWQEKLIRRPYNTFKAVLSEAQSHTVSDFVIPQHSESTHYPLPSVVFRMFDYTDAPEDLPLPGAHSIERHLMEESIQRIIANHYKDKKDCAVQLLSAPGKGKMPLDHIITEVILGQLFRLPSPSYVHVFYGSLLIELVKLQPNTMPGIIAQSVELLFERLDTMNVTCIDSILYSHLQDLDKLTSVDFFFGFIIYPQTGFISWFSFHLSNFQYKWTWDDWSHYAKSEPHTNVKKVRFIRETLGKCMRLSYYQFVQNFLPEPMYPLLPTNPQGNFRFEGENGEAGNDVVKKLISCIKAKKDIDTLLATLDEIPFSSLSDSLSMDSNNSTPNFASFRLEIFLLTILRAGVKSISHTYSALTKFLQVFKAVVVSEDAEHHCLTVTKEFWSRNEQMMVIVIDKLVKLQIVSSNVVVNWLFSKEMKEDFQRLYVWEIMHSTLKKVLKRKIKAAKDLLDTKEKIQRSKERMKRKEIRKEAADEDQDDEMSNKDTLGKLQNDISTLENEEESLIEKLESAQTYQKQLFLILFQRFIMVLTDHIVQCEQQQTAVVTPWFKYTLQRLQEVLLTYHDEITQYIPTLESIIFTVDLDSHVTRVFDSFKRLKS